VLKIKEWPEGTDRKEMATVKETIEYGLQKLGVKDGLVEVKIKGYVGYKISFPKDREGGGGRLSSPY
jgi:hypothetical protein